ncbi:hypothetical protein [Methanobacterium alcaliphilum]|uniref:hypothetical protein n=1 Tax=Methanobacterium alcaliphilum TaxID=392018 RepID=UPI00200B5DBD|nr:hypothetical protein [Methanobacterium alcaliphilum]MCK9150892.1 hypothetical protein [Methanobacterium alcaliphilum]
MVKINSCPKCGSNKIKWENPQLGTWKCLKCGYHGKIVIEKDNLDKQAKEAKKMEKLQKKIMRGRL